MNIIDQLGALQAQISDLRKLESDLKKAVIAAGGGEGELFKATVVESNRNTVDWKTIAQRLEPSRQLVQAHTKHGTTTSVRVVARSTDRRAA